MLRSPSTEENSLQNSLALTADLSFRAELLIDERKAGELVLVDATNNVVWNRRQHRLFAREFRVEIDGVACASLKWD